MKISIFGLGYVGAVTAACLARNGHQVIGVDSDPQKVTLINEGKSPIIEPGLQELIFDAVDAGNLRATSDFRYAIENSTLSMICVGTPSLPNGDLDLSYVKRVSEQLADAIGSKQCKQHTIVYRSTMLPGTMAGQVLPILNKETPSSNCVLGVCINPEFLREGSAIQDFDNPPKIVVGTNESTAADRVLSLYSDVDAPTFVTDLRTAEMVKYTDNVWHALKVVFANEIGSISRGMCVDSQEVMNIFSADTSLNISRKYLKPGYAFGGSCLPKDLRALNYLSKTMDLELPLLSSILPSNRAHIDRAFELIVATGNRRIGVLGFSFKKGTDDLRESAVVELVERLHGKGYQLRIYDPNVNLARLVGANKVFLESHLPHVEKMMMPDVRQVVEFGETIVLGTDEPVFRELIAKVVISNKTIVDLVRIADDHIPSENYIGICW